MLIKSMYLFILSLILSMPFQELPHLKHQWNHRVLLVMTNDTNTEAYQQQIEELTRNLNALNERKLIVYQINRHSFKQGFDSKSPWITNKNWYDLYADKKKSLEIVLFGLDGVKKLNTEQLLSLEKLFETIDAMPMRRSEIYRKN